MYIYDKLTAREMRQSDDNRRQSEYRHKKISPMRLGRLTERLFFLRNFKKAIVSVISCLTASMVILPQAAAAAEVPNGNGMYGESAQYAGNAGEDEEAWLKMLNPQVTDEQWELYESFENPEAAGWVIVNETERMENGHLIVDKIYTEAAVPAFEVEGEKSFGASSEVFLNGDRNSKLLMRMFVRATFSWKNMPATERFARVDENSINGFYIKQVDDQELKVLADYPDYRVDFIYNFQTCAKATYYVVTKDASENIKTYNVEVAVNSMGEQVIGNGIKYQ